MDGVRVLLLLGSFEVLVSSAHLGQEGRLPEVGGLGSLLLEDPR